MPLYTPFTKAPAEYQEVDDPSPPAQSEVGGGRLLRSSQSSGACRLLTRQCRFKSFLPSRPNNASRVGFLLRKGLGILFITTVLGNHRRFPTAACFPMFPLCSAPTVQLRPRPVRFCKNTGVDPTSASKSVRNWINNTRKPRSYDIKDRDGNVVESRRFHPWPERSRRPEQSNLDPDPASKRSIKARRRSTLQEVEQSFSMTLPEDRALE